MTVLVADPVSPELVLVSPPEVARLARAQLRALQRRPVQAASRAKRGTAPHAYELLLVYLFCLLVTLGPLLLTMLFEPIRAAP